MKLLGTALALVLAATVSAQANYTSLDKQGAWEAFKWVGDIKHCGIQTYWPNGGKAIFRLSPDLVEFTIYDPNINFSETKNKMSFTFVSPIERVDYPTSYDVIPAQNDKNQVFAKIGMDPAFFFGLVVANSFTARWDNFSYSMNLDGVDRLLKKVVHCAEQI